MNHEFDEWEEKFEEFGGYDDLEDEEEDHLLIEGEIVDVNGQALKEGDWINIKDIRLKVDMTGYVVEILKDLGCVYAVVINKEENKYHMSCVPIHRISVQVVPNSCTLEDIDVMIDMALEFKDKEWFQELTMLRNMITGVQPQRTRL